VRPGTGWRQAPEFNGDLPEQYERKRLAPALSVPARTEVLMRRLIPVSVLSALAVMVAAASSLASAMPGSAAAAAGRAGAGRQPTAVGTGGGAASMDLNASKATITVLKQGGNAIDAAAAAGSTMG